MPNKPKAFDIVRAHIEERILDGSLDIGDTLAAERELATEFGVSRGAVREAIRALEAQGVVESSVGAGATGGTRIIRARTRALTRLLRLHVALAGGRLREVVELRVALERSSATLAAASVTPEALETMRTLLAEMRGEGVDIETFNRLDTDFHVAIARAADNTLVTDLTTRGVRVDFHREGLTFTGDRNPMNTLLLTMLGAVAEFLRAQTLENQREGIAKAKQAGKYKGRKKALSAQQVEEIRTRVAAGEKKTTLAREFGVHRDTLYAALRR